VQAFVNSVSGRAPTSLQGLSGAPLGILGPTRAPPCPWRGCGWLTGICIPDPSIRHPTNRTMACAPSPL
jgi:hypothetical protein